jgi:hypothetical protein
MSSKVHKLKTWSEYFLAVASGDKTFDHRKNDRDFKVGDILELEEWDKDKEIYTGNKIVARVTYVLKDTLNVPEGYAILSIKLIYRKINMC